ncbi:MAG TPA: M48 family metalloprotease [Candidatus Saccharimonadales bacterium]|nr:M48 family metalloprotease [Candidatus Saccharimonadales bacterium]
MQYIIFAILFFYTANWRLIQNWFVKDTSGSNVLTNKITDKKISDFIYASTKVKLAHVYIAPSKTLFAFCGGITRTPILVISKGAYESFKGDALEWLLLHEMGHHVLDHTLGITTVQLSYAIIGGFILMQLHSVWLLIITIPLLSVLFAIAAIQTNKIFDFYANAFAVKKMKNPLGMKEGAMLLMKQAQRNGITQDTLLMKLFYQWNYGMWYRTIRDAEKENEKRNSVYNT